MARPVIWPQTAHIDGRCLHARVPLQQGGQVLIAMQTVAESGYPGFDLTTWFMLTGPAGFDAPALACSQEPSTQTGHESKEIGRSP
ncbi:hypothetical protein C2U69_05875 [Cupriavidus pinatubonensis]|nr:hypothetical protein C2U69_05875 [Cupriavidus pinatubonensis]